MKFGEEPRDLILEKAAISYIEQEGKRIEAEIEELKKDPSLQPSQEQREEFVKMITQHKARLNRRRRQKHAMQFAVILLAVIVGFTSISFVFVEAFRVGVLYMLRNFRETHVEIGVGDTINMSEEDMKLVQYILPGFRVVSYDINPHEEYLYAENDLGNFITVSQLDEDASINIDTEGALVSEIQTAIGTILIIERSERHTALWNDGGYYYNLYTDVDIEQLEKIFK